jgi:hypothetical protein
MNTNANQEFLEHTKNKTILCAKLTFGDPGWHDSVSYVIPLGYYRCDLELFLNQINKEYDSGYGGQELFGTIWYTDGTWSTRGEYDGSEWWEYHTCPDIPLDLFKD